MTGPKLPLAVVPAPSPTQFGSRRRGVVVLVLIAVLLGLAAFFTAAAQSEQAGTVTFVTPEGQRIPVALDSVEPDVKDATYTVRSARGAVTTVSVPQGWSLDTLASNGELQGRSVSDFLVAAALKDAQRTIEDAQIIRLAVDDQQRFADLLLDPPPLAPAMQRARQARQRLIVDSQ